MLSYFCVSLKFFIIIFFRLPFMMRSYDYKQGLLLGGWGEWVWASPQPMVSPSAWRKPVVSLKTYVALKDRQLLGELTAWSWLCSLP